MTVGVSTRLERPFYARSALEVAPDLLNKVLVNPFGAETELELGGDHLPIGFAVARLADRAGVAKPWRSGAQPARRDG